MILKISTLNRRPSANSPKKVFWNAFMDEIRHNFPFVVAFCLACFFVLVVPQTLRLVNQYQKSGAMDQIFNAVVSGQTPIKYMFGLNPCSVVLFPVLAFILPLLQFSYLTNKRAMDVYAALPIRREKAILARIFSGLVILMVPTILCLGILFVANGIALGFTSYLFSEFIFTILASFVFMLIPYAVTVLVATLAGTLIEHILYPLVFLVSPLLLGYGADAIFQSNIYGYGGSGQITKITGYLFPYVGGYLKSIWFSRGLSNEMLHKAGISKAGMTGMGSPFMFQLLIWTVLSVGLLILAIRCFQRRNSEIAGKRGASRVLSGVTLFLTMSITGIVAFLIPQFIWTDDDLMYAARYVFFFLGTMLAFVVFRLVVYHSAGEMVRSFRKYLYVLPVYVIFVAFILTSGFGAFNQIPAVKEIKEVSISYTGLDGGGTESGIYGYSSRVSSASDFHTNDPDVIKIITDFNQTALDTRVTNPFHYQNIQVTYTLKNRHRVMRSYQSLSPEAMTKLTALENVAKFKEKTHMVYNLDFTVYDTAVIRDIYLTNSEKMDMSVLDLEKLQAALQRDVLEERFEQIQNSSKPSLGSIVLQIEHYVYDLKTQNYPTELVLYIKDYYTNTIAYLEDIGVMDLFETKYENIEELMVVSQNGQIDDTRSQSLLGLSVGSMMPSYIGIPDLFYCGTLNTYRDYETQKQLFSKENIENIEVQTVNDPDEIKSILKDCYTQHTFDDNDQIVCVKTSLDDRISAEFVRVMP